MVAAHSGTSGNQHPAGEVLEGKVEKRQSKVDFFVPSRVFCHQNLGRQWRVLGGLGESFQSEDGVRKANPESSNKIHFPVAGKLQIPSWSCSGFSDQQAENQEEQRHFLSSRKLLSLRTCWPQEIKLARGV